MTSIPIGSSAIIQNLINGAQYNGLNAVIKSEIDPSTQRQNVLIASINKVIAVKRVNLLPCDVSAMSVRELKGELHSYNISTESFLDKASLVDAVMKARREGWRRPTIISTGTSSTPNDSGSNGGGRQENGNSTNSNAAESASASFSSGYQTSKKRPSTDIGGGNESSNDSSSSSSKKKSKGNLPVEVALAKTWNETTNITGFYMSEKLDGMRIIWDGKGNLYSRNGNLVLAPLFFVRALPAGTVLDGELFLERGEFQQCMSIAKQSNERDWRQLTFVVFDAPLIKGNFETRLQAARNALARAQVATSIAKVHEQVICRGKSHVYEELDRITALDGEGVMLRNPAAQYKGGRVSDLLKVKKFHDAEARVVGQEEGKGRNEGRLGALVCVMMNDNTKQFKVGSGFTDSEREWENAPRIGSNITYRYFELTKAGLPRFPTFQRVRPSE